VLFWPTLLFSSFGPFSFAKVLREIELDWMVDLFFKEPLLNSVDLSCESALASVYKAKINPNILKMNFTAVTTGLSLKVAVFLFATELKD